MDRSMSGFDLFGQAMGLSAGGIIIKRNRKEIGYMDYKVVVVDAGNGWVRDVPCH